MGHPEQGKRTKKSLVNFCVRCIKSGILLGTAVVMCIYTPYEQVLKERLRMRPGLPPYEMWKSSPDIGRLSIYLFNITNAEKYLSGEDLKLKFDQIGPITLNEIWTYENITFNENSTLTYKLKKTGIYRKENNFVNLNDTITVFNFPLLLTATYIADGLHITKFGFNNMVRILNLRPIITMSVYDYLYNNKDALLSGLSTFLPSVVPFDNAGIANLLYFRSEDTSTIFIGSEHGNSRFSLIDKFDGSEYLPGYQDDCKVTLTNSSECMVLQQEVQKTDVIYYLRKKLCRLIPIYYKETQSRFGLPAYLFEVKPSFLNRTFPPEEDCYKGESPLPDGASDMSTCWGGLSLVSSTPYFDQGDAKLREKVEFNVEKPAPLPNIVVEPVSGVPFERNAIIQVNALVKPLYGFDRRFDKFNDTILPLFWIRIWNEDMPFSMLALLYLFHIIYYVQWIVVGLLVFFAVKIFRRKSTEPNNNKII